MLVAKRKLHILTLLSILVLRDKPEILIESFDRIIGKPTFYDENNASGVFHEVDVSLVN